MSCTHSHSNNKSTYVYPSKLEDKTVLRKNTVKIKINQTEISVNDMNGIQIFTYFKRSHFWRNLSEITDEFIGDSNNSDPYYGKFKELTITGYDEDKKKYVDIVFNENFKAKKYKLDRNNYHLYMGTKNFYIAKFKN